MRFIVSTLERAKGDEQDMMEVLCLRYQQMGIKLLGVNTSWHINGSHIHPYDGLLCEDCTRRTSYYVPEIWAGALLSTAVIFLFSV